MKLFLLEDDENLAFGIESYLKKAGYDLVHASSLKEAEDLFDYSFDLYILDINLGDGSAFDFLRTYKIETSPIIFLTVNDSEEDIVKGLNLADGYMTKPFKLSILKAKIDSVLRRVDSKDRKLRYRELVLDLDSHRLLLGSEEVKLTAKEFELLSLLMKNRPGILTRQRLLDQIWGLDGEFIDDNSLSAAVKRLRKKLGDYGYVVETVRGVGYRFVRD